MEFGTIPQPSTLHLLPMRKFRLGPDGQIALQIGVLPMSSARYRLGHCFQRSQFQSYPNQPFPSRTILLVGTTIHVRIFDGTPRGLAVTSWAMGPES